MLPKKIIVTEDQDDIGYSLKAKLKQEVGASEIILSQYCNESYIKLQKAERDGNPFDLLITDLSFKEDYKSAGFISGEQLIKKVRQLWPELPIMVYSVEDRKPLINKLFKKHHINAYVLKGREGLKQMVLAVRAIERHQTYLSPEIEEQLKRKPVTEIGEVDVKILTMLAQGHSQEQIAEILRKNGIKPYSLSFIEKKLNRLKDEFKVKSTIQLVALSIDMGFI